MRRYVQGFGQSYYTMPVDVQKAREIADTYYRNGAWTWMDDYVWFGSECFVQGPLESQPQPCTGALFPVNYLRVPFVAAKTGQEQVGIYRKIRRTIRSIARPSKPSPTNAATG